MHLDQLTIEIRPRRSWEAVDLGLLMACRWWWPMMRVWLILTLPLFALLNFLPGNWLWLSYMLIWWLKPIFERPLLHILSQAVFDHAPDTRSTLKAFPAIAWRQIFLSLTLRRFSPSRSLDLPVIQLEGLQGRRRRERLTILHLEDSNPATWLTIIGIHIEAVLGLGMAMLLYMLIPSEITIDWISLFTSQDAAWFGLLINSCNYLAIALVAPFYVACGFSLYLNRRIKLEAWDIDIAFQRIVNRRRLKPAPQLIALLLALGLSYGLVLAPETLAEDYELSGVEATKNPENAPPELSRATTRTAIEAILAEETFHQKHLMRYPRFLDNTDKDQKDEPEETSDAWKIFLGLFESAEKIALIASGFEILLWACVICLIFLVVFRYRHWLATYLPSNIAVAVQRPKPLTLFGLDVARESLPDDVSASALALWQHSEQRAALALLYRASLSRLLDGGLEIDEGNTEQECLHRAEIFATHHPRARAAVDYFTRLTNLWRRLAYGHIPPDGQAAERLCQEWNRVWQATDSTSTTPVTASIVEADNEKV